MSDRQMQNLRRLRGELAKLKRKTNFGHSLTLEWSPTAMHSLSGEVVGDFIIVYEEDIEKALNTLRHEFVDYLVSQAILPFERLSKTYIGMLNVVIKKENDEAYDRKEQVVEALLKIL